MSKIIVSCSRCGWSEEIAEEEIDTVSLKQDYCDNGCSETITYNPM